MKTYFLIILIIIPYLILAQNNERSHTLSGFIYDASNGETLIGANVFVRELGVGTSSNIYGFYSLTLPNGEYDVEVSFIGYNKISQKIDSNKGQNLDFRIQPTSVDLEEVIIVGEKADYNVKSTEMGTNDIVPKEIEKVPVIFGERDILKTIQFLPGISTAGEGNSGFIVRGGSSDQNLVILDEAPVYNPSHLLGFFSVFNSDAIKNAKIIKGIAGPEYGGRLSSVLDIAMKDGGNQDFSFYGGLGLISSRLTVEGPITKDKGSFILSGRRTYADVFFPLFGDEQLENSTLYFYDLNAKLNYFIGKDDRIFFSAYSGRDIFAFNDEFGFDWGNTTATLRLNHVFSSKLFSNTTLMYSDYNYDISIDDVDQSTTVSSGIKDFHLKSDLQYFFNSDNTLKFGINAIHHTFNPGAIKTSGNSIFNSKKVDDLFALEGNLYLGHEWSINPLLKLNYGLRYSNFTLIGPATIYSLNEEELSINIDEYKSGEIIKSYNFLEPRLSVNYLLTESSSLKLGYARNTQNIHLLSTSTTSTPLDIWQPSTATIKPQVSDLFSIGYFKNFYENKYSASFELYYKDMRNLIEYKNGADIFLNEFIESQLVFGYGWSYGAELYIERKLGKFTGWLSYTLSTTQRKFNEINNGNPFPARQDRTHDISIVGMYNLTDNWVLSANWVYYTGLAVTYPAGKYSIDGLTINLYTDRNAQRLPDYHRLDIGATYYFKKTAKNEMSINFSLYNLYARENAYRVTFEEIENNPNATQAIKLALFSIVPSISFNFKF